MRFEFRAGRFRLVFETGQGAEPAPAEIGGLCFEPAPAEEKEGPLYIPPALEECLALTDIEDDDDR